LFFMELGKEPVLGVFRKSIPVKFPPGERVSPGVH